MDDVAEASSRAQATDHDTSITDAELEADLEEQRKYKKEWRLEAKRKRIRMLSQLLTELDVMVYMNFIAIYHME